jgi:hypothetical protein
MALGSTLSVLIALTVPMLALLSSSAFEPLIARNLVDAARALYLAEAGIEWAMSLVVTTSDGELQIRDSAGQALGDTPMALVPPAGLLSWGTTTITARRAPDARVVVTSTGTVNGAQRTVEAAVMRPELPAARWSPTNAVRQSGRASLGFKPPTSVRLGVEKSSAVKLRCRA